MLLPGALAASGASVGEGGKGGGGGVAVEGKEDVIHDKVPGAIW